MALAFLLLKVELYVKHDGCSYKFSSVTETRHRLYGTVKVLQLCQILSTEDQYAGWE